MTKILADVSINFSAASVSATSFTVSFNWITETGIYAGSTNAQIPFPQGPLALNVNILNQAIVSAITASINASGKYTVQSNDEVILMGGFTTMYLVPHAH